LYNCISDDKFTSDFTQPKEKNVEGAKGGEV
jgi:hypothetical protein